MMHAMTIIMQEQLFVAKIMCEEELYLQMRKFEGSRTSKQK